MAAFTTITCIYCGAQEYRAMTTKMCHQCRKITQPILAKAGLTMRNAIKRGDIKPASNYPCEDCGKPAQTYDHRDNDQPLLLAPVCWSCNRLRGPSCIPSALKQLLATTNQ